MLKRVVTWALVVSLLQIGGPWGTWKSTPAPAVNTFAYADDNADMMEMLALFLQQYPETLEYWGVTNDSLGTISDVLSSPEKGFLVGASVAIGGVVGGAVAQLAIEVLELGVKALYEGVTHEKRNAKITEVFNRAKSKLQEMHDNERELEKQIKGIALLRLAVKDYSVRSATIFQKMESEISQLRSLIRLEESELDRTNLQIKELRAEEGDPTEMEARTTLLQDNLGDFTVAMQSRMKTKALLEDFEYGQSCSNALEAIRRLKKLDWAMDYARTEVLKGKFLYMKAKATELKEGNKNLEFAARKAIRSQGVRPVERAEQNAYRDDLRRLQRDDSRYQRAYVERCVGMPVTLPVPMCEWRYQFTPEANLVRQEKAKLQAQHEEFLRATQEEESQEMEELAELDLDSAKFRVALATEYQWFDQLRDELKNSKVKTMQIERFERDLAYTGCVAGR